MIPVVETENLVKTYIMGKVKVEALKGVSITIKKGEMVSILGPSGSGKSTLMNMIGCLDIPSKGKVMLDGIDTSTMNEKSLAAVRNNKIGFVFQQFNLLPGSNLLENVSVPLFYSGVSSAERKERAAEVLEQVGLGDRMKHLPGELSGGQKQRAAIARALINKPSLLLADEPTGALDQKTGNRILELFFKLNEEGNTLVVVTHDPEIGSKAQRSINILDGLAV